ncbi:hypothetical protein TIFTF001_042866 [Ficus carica]|uniref:Uncharacterized protein n=1 Tax=Ficus carica TaxID=3494 RepID=A0AA88CK75_FICCA|nr:hypothetical protein TIFTF001_042862 [Ficus carica]GMN19377.1 hypothetical protein TIFTF001_042866 [Ficus carica]
MPPIRGSSSEDILLSELGAKITAAFRRARPEHYYGETHPGDWLYHIESLCSSCHFLYRGRMVDLTYAQGRRFFARAARWAPVHEVIYAEMHLRVERVDTPPIRGLENAEDASSHVEAPAPQQPEAVGDDDARTDPKKEDPTEVFTEGEDDETDGP